MNSIRKKPNLYDSYNATLKAKRQQVGASFLPGPVRSLFESFSFKSYTFSFDWREYSFLDNPRLPEDVLSEAMTIVDRSTEDIKFPLTDKKVKATLGSEKYKKVKLLKFENILDIFDGDKVFENEDQNKDFKEKIMRLTEGWCCQKAIKGHRAPSIFYDMWFDIIPHKNRHGKLIEKEWAPGITMIRSFILCFVLLLSKLSQYLE